MAKSTGGKGRGGGRAADSARESVEPPGPASVGEFEGDAMALAEADAAQVNARDPARGAYPRHLPIPEPSQPIAFKRWEHAAQDIAAGKRTGEIAERLGVGSGQVSKYRAEPVIRRRVEYLQTMIELEVRTRVSAQRLRALDALGEGAESAAGALVEVIRGEAPADSAVSPQTRVQASTALLDRIGLGASSTRAVAVSGPDGGPVQLAVQFDDLAYLRQAIGLGLDVSAEE